MRIAVAPNAFRGSLTALEATACIVAGLEQSALGKNPAKPLETVPLPLADGGDGTLDVLLQGLGGTRESFAVTGPDGSSVQAEMGLLGDGQTAIIEMARASGVELLPRERRNPRITTTYGTGELIDAALQRGYRRIVLGIGGSATVDGGAGCLQALGARLLDAEGMPIPPGGGGLAKLAAIDVTSMREHLEGTEITVLCDVTNPLTGPNGAAYVFGPQKGADPAMVEMLDTNLAHFAAVMRRDLGVDVEMLPGAGAAGGFGAGMVALAGAKLAPGGVALIDLLGYEPKLRGANLVITGEGKLDSQTEGGKAVQRIAEVAAQAAIPVVALAGMVEAESDTLNKLGIVSAWSIVPGPCTLEMALTNAPHWLTNAARTLGDLLAIQ